MQDLAGRLEKRQKHCTFCHPPSLVFSWRVFPGRISRMGDGASRVPVSRATGGAMLNRMCCVLIKLTVLSMRAPADGDRVDRTKSIT